MVKLVYTQSHAKGSTGTCVLSSGLWKKQVSRDSSYNRQNSGIIGLRHLSHSQTTPLQIPVALYQTRRNEVIGEEQYQINNPTKPCIIPLQVLNK